MEYVRWAAGLVLVIFALYTLHCMRKEKFLKSAGTIWSLRWGKQITFDLYLGLFIFSFFILLNEGSFVSMLLWLFPTLLFGNLTTLLYFVIYFDSILANFS